ncbi:MAG: hypothetical protein AB7K68_12635 [Bacteriovoracia bacterium]
MKKLLPSLFLLTLAALASLPAHADAFFTFGTQSRGQTEQVRPGVFKTQIARDKARDVTFQHEAGLPLFLGAIPYSTTERRGDENACANAKAQAVAAGMIACQTKYGRCSTLSAIREEGETFCRYTVFTQSESAKKFKNASLEEDSEQEENYEAQDAA